MRIHRLFAVLAVAGIASFTSPAWTEDTGPTPPGTGTPGASPTMSPEDQFGMMEKGFGEEHAKIKAMREEATKRRDPVRLKALEQMEQELAAKRSAKLAELKSKLGEEGFARMQAKWKERKARMDADKDGAVEPGERRNAEKVKGRLDRNEDGKVGKMEREKAKRMKDRADRNDDGKVGKAEREKAKSMKKRADKIRDAKACPAEGNKAKEACEEKGKRSPDGSTSKRKSSRR